uniref:Uncharacterized protein n=1 Tax=Arundo donax TaxID=35708 RepID=A0A0A9DKX1_ARUDO
MKANSFGSAPMDTLATTLLPKGDVVNHVYERCGQWKSCDSSTI